MPKQDVCRSLLTKYLHIIIPNLRINKLCFFCGYSLYVPCSCEFPPPCLVTTDLERKQGIRRSKLEGANSWRLHRRQDRIRTATCPKLRVNVLTTTSCPYIKVDPYLFSYLLLFKTNHSALWTNSSSLGYTY